tara:strand:+ start:380 stop:916 length:537 start_codon:yes stop_codon:yes gene_type:complete
MKKVTLTISLLITTLILLSACGETSVKDDQKYYTSGIAALELGDPNAAIQDFTTSIEANPERREVYHRRALAYRSLGRFDEAKADLDEAIRLDPKFLGAIIARGDHNLKFGDCQASLADFETAIPLSVFHAESYAGKAKALACLGDDVGSQTLMEEAIDLGFLRSKIESEIAEIKANR